MIVEIIAFFCSILTGYSKKTKVISRIMEESKKANKYVSYTKLIRDMGLYETEIKMRIRTMQICLIFYPLISIVTYVSAFFLIIIMSIEMENLLLWMKIAITLVLIFLLSIREVTLLRKRAFDDNEKIERLEKVLYS